MSASKTILLDQDASQVEETPCYTVSFYLTQEDYEEKLMKVRQSQDVGVIKNATVLQAATGNYYVILNLEFHPELRTNEGGVIGIHMGLQEFYWDSNGKSVENPRYLEKKERKLRREQRGLSRKKQGSHNYEKQRMVVAKVHEKIANQRNDFLQQQSSALIRENQTICIKDLNVTHMLKNTRLAKQIASVSWSKFFEMLRYKGSWYGNEIRKVPSWYQTTQTCSACGNQNPLIKDIRVRIWECPVCHKVHERGSVKETTAPTGYVLNTSTTRTVTITNNSTNSVIVDGKTYAKGAVVATITTNSSGIATTSSSLLPYGSYIVKETTAPTTGYLLNTTDSKTITISSNNTIVDFTNNGISDDVIRGGVSIAKYDSEIEDAQGEATLAGAVFEITNNSTNSVVVNGTTYAKGAVVATITTNANGIATTASDLLPYGSYTIKEVTAPSGYLNEGVISRSFTITQDGVVYNYGDVVATIVAGEDSVASTETDTLPYGSYSIAETVEPEGYFPTDTVLYFSIKEDGVIVDPEPEDDRPVAFYNQIIRGDIELVKIANTTMERMSGITFLITNIATGESHNQCDKRWLYY